MELCVKVSSPKRMGTRTIAFLVKSVGLFFRSMTLLTNKRTAFEPISIAAYLDILKVCLVYFHNMNISPAVSAAGQRHYCGKQV